MSGFEITGVVLAVFPIVVDGLQRFTNGVRTIKSWRRYKTELAKYSRTLETQSVVYMNTIELLFDGIIQSNHEIDETMKRPGGLWIPYEEKLRVRLGRSYQTYLRIMKDMLEALEATRKELGLDDDGKAR